MTIQGKIVGLGSVAAVGLLLGALTGCSSNSNDTTVSTTSTGRSGAATASGANWLIAVHADDTAEVQAGQLAEKAGSTKAVRDTGRMLAADHALIDAGITMLAQKYNVTLPTQLPSAVSAELQKLQGLQGSAFDQSFVPFFIAGHRSAVSATEGEIGAAGGPGDIVGYAKVVLPVIQRHLDHLQMEATGH